MAPAYPEAKALRPLSAEERPNSDHWPEFVLRGVKVVSQQTGELSTLLSAHAGNKMTVTGKLGKLDKDDAHLVQDPAYIGERILVKNVSVYSFSQFDDGSFGFWAAGQAGWYEIRTVAPGYNSIFRSMQEATSMFYFLADKFASDGKVRTPEKYVSALMQEYANAEHSRRRAAADVKEGFYEHKDFLIRSMLEGQEGLDWQASAILRHFRKYFPTDFNAWWQIVHEQGKAEPPDPNDMEVDSEQSQDQPPEEMTKARPGRRPRGAVDSKEESPDSTPMSEVPTRSRGGLRLRGDQAKKRYSGAFAPQGKQAGEDSSEASDPDGEPPGVPQRPLHRPNRNQTSETPKDLWDEVTATSLSFPEYYEPRGPSDTWTCSYDGCNHQVWDARTAQSRKLIEDHFASKHAGAMEDLIVSESGGKGSVQHLLSRVKNFKAMDAGALAQIVGREMPQRVARRY